MHYALFYTYAPDYMSRRELYRAAHLALAWESVERGELQLGGALGEPTDTGLLIFRCDSPAPIERFVAADPYVLHGVVTAWRIRPWTTVVGPEASTPIRP
ncbi:YciI-like protein [Massilia sp. TS11]|uniref:YciI-like protein n=1 Tax=Massilia sp. TS11 TaxID=2908003 RepID=UPI001EDA2BF8|nr:YciI-like protein [Massilia sp. TS11]MCG2586783.1 YciI family protein [Massilia sp. TS11]